MKLGQQIIKELYELKEKIPEQKSKEKFLLYQTKLDNCQIQIKFKDIDKYGIVFDYISIKKETPILDVELINRTLEKQAELIQKTITYLLEDFRLIELDTMNKRAQLRSYPPYKKDDSKFYYEIVLDEGIRFHLQRYEYSRTKKRYEKITSQLTLEMFERLLEDVIKILGECPESSQ